MNRILHAMSGMALACLPLLSNGQTLWSVGYNLHGELGNGTWGTGFPGTTIKQAGTIADWKYIDAQGATTLAIRSDNSLWGWGGNLSGQLGDGTSTQSPTPKQTGTDKDWVTVSEGENHAVGLKTDGTIWTWGSNSFGALGNGTTTTTSADLTPAKMGTDNNWSVIAAGQWFTIALKTDGTLWYWGHDNAGSVLSQPNATQIGTDNDWKSIATGWNSHSIAIKKDGTMWAWGLNDKGQLGQGTTGFPNATLTKIGTDNNWASASVGHGYTLAMKTDGTLWSWGWNDRGQIGDGTTADKNVPTQVGTANNWKYATAGRKHSLAIKTDGTLWAWGWNGDSQLGDGTTTDAKTPQQVGTATNWESVTGDERYTIGLRKSTVAIANIDANSNEAMVYPNPATGRINISATGNITTTIYDVTGRILLVSEDKVINISTLANGVMIYKINSANNQYNTGTFIKQ